MHWREAENACVRTQTSVCGCVMECRRMCECLQVATPCTQPARWLPQKNTHVRNVRSREAD